MGIDLIKCLEIDVSGVLINSKPSITANDEVINKNMIKCETFGSIFGNVFLHPHTKLLIIIK